MGKKTRTRQLVRAAGAGSSLERLPDPISIGPDGSLAIDVAKLGTPQDLYDADYAWPKRRGGAVSLFFGKANLDEPTKLRTRLELRYPIETFFHHLWNNSRDFHARIKEFLSRRPRDKDRDKLDPAKMKADRDHSDWVNIDYLAHTGTEAALDFFQLSPGGLAMFAQGKGASRLVMTPKVRVQTATEELCRLLDACEPIAQEVKEELERFSLPALEAEPERGIGR
jgi:hypothetical protein